LLAGRSALTLSWSTPFEVDLTELYQKLVATYDHAGNPAQRHHRRSDHGQAARHEADDRRLSERHDRHRHALRRRPARHARPAHTTTTAPCAGHKFRQAVLDAAKKFLAVDIHDGAFGALGPHAFMRPWAGSNNWAVAPSLANGKALLATDQHLSCRILRSSIPTHVIVAGKTDVLGVTFPGIPASSSDERRSRMGRDGERARRQRRVPRNDRAVRRRQLRCVQGQQVPIQPWTETIQIGALGTITSSVTATYELVPHHGPIIPTIANHQIVPRTASQAMSVEYTGYQPTFEIRACGTSATRRPSTTASARSPTSRTAARTGR